VTPSDKIGTSDSILDGKRWPPVIFGAVSPAHPPNSLNLTLQIINIISYTSLAIWNIPTGWKWTCYIIAGAGHGLSGLLMAYVLPPPFTVCITN
jgi:hypothetical protein